MPSWASLPCLSLSHCCCVLHPCASSAAALQHLSPLCHLTPGSVCASSSPVLLPLAASHLHCSSSPASAPSLFLPQCSHDSQIHRQLHRVAASPAQGALAPLGHCCSTNAPSHPKICCGGCCLLCCGWEDSRMSCTTGSCSCLHPLSASSGPALPPAAAPRGTDPLLAAAGQGMPSPTGPALTLPFTHL